MMAMYHPAKAVVMMRATPTTSVTRPQVLFFFMRTTMAGNVPPRTGAAWRVSAESGGQGPDACGSPLDLSKHVFGTPGRAGAAQKTRMLSGYRSLRPLVDRHCRPAPRRLAGQALCVENRGRLGGDQSKSGLVPQCIPCFSTGSRPLILANSGRAARCNRCGRGSRSAWSDGGSG